jgi:hypothetical protein
MDYKIDAVDPEDLVAFEASILWYTEGKGDEDLAVHYFERRTAGEVAADVISGGDLRELRKVSVTLPNSPLSYQGAIVKVRWCARVRAFLRGGKETFFECPFQLGAVPAATAIANVPSGRDSGPAEAQTGAADGQTGPAETWLVGSESRLASRQARSSGNGRAASAERGATPEEADAE